MNTTELKKSLELRQENLIFLLKNKKQQLELEKQHQIYGAVKEIDYILRMMKYNESDESQEILMNEQTVDENMDVQQQVMTENVIVAERERKFRIPIKFKFLKE
jgi:hypothetical protein